jgi:hypothetical protein
VFERIASPVTAPSAAAYQSERRDQATSASSTIAAPSSPSRISRLTCTSCQTRYGWRVAIAAATSPARGETTRRPSSYTRIAVATATPVWTSPSASHESPKSHCTGTRKSAYSGCVDAVGTSGRNPNVPLSTKTPAMIQLFSRNVATRSPRSYRTTASRGSAAIAATSA